MKWSHWVYNTTPELGDYVQISFTVNESVSPDRVILREGLVQWLSPTRLKLIGKTVPAKYLHLAWRRAELPDYAPAPVRARRI